MENFNHVALTSLTWNGRVKSYSSSFLLGIYRFNFTVYRFKNLTPPKLLDCHLDSRSRSNSCVCCLLLIHLHTTCHKCMFKFILSSYISPPNAGRTRWCWCNWRQEWHSLGSADPTSSHDPTKDGTSKPSFKWSFEEKFSIYSKPK